MSRPLIATWGGCPQHYFRDALSPRHAEVHSLLAQAACEWDRIICPCPIRRLTRVRAKVTFCPQRYQPVVAVASTAALEQTVWHVSMLRRHPRVQSNLAALAFLERFEAAVAAELAQRRAEVVSIAGVPWWMSLSPAVLDWPSSAPVGAKRGSRRSAQPT